MPKKIIVPGSRKRPGLYSFKNIDILVTAMKKGIHPKVNKECLVTCACGNTFTTISTLPSISVEICGACHPFYTGQRRFVDTEKRIDKFNRKMILADEKKKAADKIKTSKKVQKKFSGSKDMSVKEMLEHIKKEGQ
ncbi:MAG: hypothetical protein UU64_C0003G0007 [candidate division WWE3 bacterium GW2011_GWF2_41_45]|uniref:Large ribosomal subunit protein bL31 n=2 Tax=Katanobacteria TaxID=422282 RepID=A0A0G0VR02_UNCKA|nr:MAG: hypothetical protein UU55_C0003G0038 [candidate division WWE3 bacterium GW2011_GWC2_41_23]KKS10498.1 MAG: hypothetical protein UU64_C0003G0007 [candidate division WWE3 bacterium GW2011_GWF2_41_45]KKS20307.1 MAG: hypothetical protein UU79_C0002G0073 [candidate division WWE3 bacterium GW2011_GWE1_41_72]KKS28093.1 MAG: Ribosomal protein L31 (Modular protein) [candidate division WWE3 bacterium GW2011_GWC1_42_102]KKS28466.1 MAG: hypothetical protein UU90_C0027G0015 [candidate division WWE3 b